jgi:plastocyanin
MKLRRHISLLAAVALLITAIDGVFPLTAGVAQSPAADAVPIAVTILLEDIRFEPATLKIPANQDVIVRLENTGAALHDFVVPELDFAVAVAPGESTEVTINAPAGRYSIICSVPGHKEAGMVGTLLVIAGPAVDPTASPSPVVVEDATALPASPAAVLDEPGCEGLPGYSRQILAIESDSWNRLVAEFGIDDASDFNSLEEDQYADLALIRDAEAAMLMQVEAPGFAEDWHQNEIASAQLEAMMARMVPQAGSPYAAIVQLWDVSEILDDQNRQAYLDAVAACPAFATFWSERSLIDGDAGTPPEATSDYSSCAGLEPYGSNLGRAFFQAYANRPELAREFFEFSEESEDDLRARTPTEFLMLAAIFMEISGEIAKVTPPDYASEWHFSQIMYYETAADFLKAAAADGFESAETEFGEQFGIVGILGDAAAEEATDECAVFYEFATS